MLARFDPLRAGPPIFVNDIGQRDMADWPVRSPIGSKAYEWKFGIRHRV
jgi:hypothetical protein